MNLVKYYLEKNQCYIQASKITPIGIMVHSTGANNPNLSRYIGPDDGKLGPNKYNNHWNSYHAGGKDIGPHPFIQGQNGSCKTCGGKQVDVHAFIGKLKDGSIATYQTLPWTYKGWHSGSGKTGKSANSLGYIGFEICEDGLTDSVYFNKVYKEAVELTAYLCKQFNLDPMKDGVVICHSEGCQRGIASNHGDVMHWFPKHNKSMDTFRLDVKAELEKQNKPVINNTPSPYAKESWEKATNKKILDGTNPHNPVSREQLAVVLDRLGLLDN